MFYDLFCSLCKNKGISPTRAALEIGLSKSTPTTWKNRSLTPQGETLSKIANYFGVTVDYLLGNSDQKETPSNSLDKELEGVEFALFGEVKELTDDEKEDILAYIKFKKSQRK